MLDALHFSSEEQPHSLTGLIAAYRKVIVSNMIPKEHYPMGQYQALETTINTYIALLNLPLVDRGARLALWKKQWTTMMEWIQENRRQGDFDRGYAEGLALVLEHLELVDDFH